MISGEITMTCECFGRLIELFQDALRDVNADPKAFRGLACELQLSTIVNPCTDRNCDSWLPSRELIFLGGPG